MKPYDYYQVDLEVALPTSDFIFGFINISHIPYAKLTEIFQGQMLKLRHAFLFQDSAGYRLTEEVYRANKSYLDQEIPFKFDFSLFEYSVGFSGCYKENYRQGYHKELPPN
jgi:hypothetical protein